MIALIAVVIGGIIVGLKIPLLSPLIYLSRFRRDLFLVLFFIYCLALGYEFEVNNIYESNLYSILIILLTIIFFFDSGMRDVSENRDKINYILIIIMLIGWFFIEIFIVALLLAFFYHFYKDNPIKGVFATLTPISILCIGLVVLKNEFSLFGSGSTQAVFIAAVSILYALIFWRKTIVLAAIKMYEK